MRFHSIGPWACLALCGTILIAAAPASGRTGAAMRVAAGEATLPPGEYACYGSGGTILIGLGFRVLPGRRYVSLDNTEGGTYVYDPAAATVTFVGGFLEGNVGQGVKNNRFSIHSASCGPF